MVLLYRVTVGAI